MICALKATAIDEAEHLVRPCVGPTTRILVLMNGLGLEERFAGWFGSKRVFGGLAFTCINRGDSGFIHHIAYGSVTLGHLENDSREIEAALSVWEPSRVTVISAPSLLRARWEKLCWNIPFNGLTVASGGVPTDRIVGDPDSRSVVRSLIAEVVAAGNADLTAHAKSERLDANSIADRMLELTDTMGPYRPSTLVDFVEGKTMEIDAIFGEPLRRARALVTATPQLDLLTAVLLDLDTAPQARNVSR